MVAPYNAQYEQMLQAQAQQHAQPVLDRGQNESNFLQMSNLYSNQDFESVLRKILGDEDFLEVVHHQFLGEVVDLSGEQPKWVRKYKPIIKNEEAISEVVQILRFMGCNTITKITCLEKSEINEKMRVFECKLADLLFLKRKAWQIEKAELPMLYNMIWNLIENALLIAKDGRLLTVLRSTYQRTEHEDRTPQQKQGLISRYLTGNSWKPM